MIDDIVVGSLRKTKLLFLLVVAVFAGSLSLNLDPDVRRILLSTVDDRDADPDRRLGQQPGSKSGSNTTERPKKTAPTERR